VEHDDRLFNHSSIYNGNGDCSGAAKMQMPFYAQVSILDSPDRAAEL